MILRAQREAERKRQERELLHLQEEQERQLRKKVADSSFNLHHAFVSLSCMKLSVTGSSRTSEPINLVFEILSR